MQGDHLKMDSGVLACYGDNTLQPPITHYRVFTKGYPTLYIETKSYWTVCAFDPAQIIQRSDRYPESQLTVDFQTVSFSLNFDLFFPPELRRMFNLQLQQRVRDYHHKSYFHLVR